MSQDLYLILVTDRSGNPKNTLLTTDPFSSVKRVTERHIPICSAQPGQLPPNAFDFTPKVDLPGVNFSFETINFYEAVTLALDTLMRDGLAPHQVAAAHNASRSVSNTVLLGEFSDMWDSGQALPPAEP
jgi:hypothetical protein